MRAALYPSSVMGPTVGFVRLPHGEGLPLPAYESAGAAGMDLRAAVPDDRPLLILPGKRALVPTGLILEIPEGMEGQVRPRSGATPATDCARKRPALSATAPGSACSAERTRRLHV